MKRIAIIAVLFSVMLQACAERPNEPKVADKATHDAMVAGALGGGCNHVRTLNEIREKKSCRQ